jgi:hypothetical protein
MYKIFSISLIFNLRGLFFDINSLCVCGTNISVCIHTHTYFSNEGFSLAHSLSLFLKKRLKGSRGKIKAPLHDENSLNAHFGIFPPPFFFFEEFSQQRWRERARAVRHKERKISASQKMKNSSSLSLSRLLPPSPFTIFFLFLLHQRRNKNTLHSFIFLSLFRLSLSNCICHPHFARSTKHQQLTDSRQCGREERGERRE